MENETQTVETAPPVQPGTAEYAASLLGTGSRTWTPVLGVPSAAQLIRGLARAGYSVESIGAILAAAGAPVKAGVVRYRVIEALADESVLLGIKSYGPDAIRRRSKDTALPQAALDFAAEVANGN